MKLTTALFLLPALALANPLTVIIEESGLGTTSGSCYEFDYYCGSYLMSKKGYTSDDLKQACHPDEHCDTKGLENTLFSCLRNSEIEKVEYCPRGCIEVGPGGRDDHCEPAFAATPGLKAQSNADTVRIEA